MTEEVRQEIEQMLNDWAKAAAKHEYKSAEYKCLIRGANAVLFEIGYDVASTGEELRVISR